MPSTSVYAAMKSTGMSKDLVVKMAKRFRDIDSSKDGGIELYEFARALGFEKPGPFTERLFDMVDVNGDGIVTYDELVLAVAATRGMGDWKTFLHHAFDGNGDGIVDPDDVHRILDFITRVLGKTPTDMVGDTVRSMNENEFKCWIDEHEEVGELIKALAADIFMDAH